jgi:hypothetical protein
MVRDGYITDGIEFKIDIKTKKRKRIRKMNGKDNEGKRQRTPFNLVQIELIDLSNDTKDNRWGYRWLMICTYKEYRTVIIYPLKGKNDVRLRWRQFHQ